MCVLFRGWSVFVRSSRITFTFMHGILHACSPSGGWRGEVKSNYCLTALFLRSLVFFFAPDGMGKKLISSNCAVWAFLLVFGHGLSDMRVYVGSEVQLPLHERKGLLHYPAFIV